MRRWNGRSGKPSGNVRISGGDAMDASATAASPSPTAAPAGNSA